MEFTHPSVAALLEMARQPAQADHLASYVQQVEETELVEWFLSLAEAINEVQGEPAGLPQLVAAVAGRYRSEGARAHPADTDGLCESAVALYRELPPTSASRGLLLALLARVGEGDSLAALADLLVEDPPEDALAVSQALLPLFSRENYDPHRLFPRLLDALSQPAAAAAVLDLANFLTREHRLEPHPAKARSEQLVQLLGGLVGRLGHLAESPSGQNDRAAQQVSDSLSLVISLCYALALVGDTEAVGKLNQALELGHRRIRTEAAYALAKLGEKRGSDELVALAAEAMVRLRVLAYAEELGIADRIDSRYTTPAARAEGELASWLALPSNLGLPPSSLETVDERSLYWPGYDDPVQCFLVRFTYDYPQGTYSNVGIVGPLTHAFTADLADLAPDDIYAAYAGWQAEHEEIFQLDLNRVSPGQEAEVDRLVRRLRDARYEKIEPLSLGFFFGQRVLVAAAEREGVSGTAIADGEDLLWFPATHHRPLGADEAYSIYKGRKLLRTFND